MEIPERVVLWHTGQVVCTCSNSPDQKIEIRLIIDNIEVECAVFTDFNTASAYAIARMDAYNSI